MNHPHQDSTTTYWTDGDTATPVFQRRDEFAQLLQRYAARRPRRVLEIGTYYGGTLKQWLRLARHGARVVSIDRYDIPRADQRARYADWTPRGVHLEVIAGDSQDPATVVHAAALGPYDWIFIDGDHTLAAVRADWATARQLAAPGAVVVFHDIIADPVHHPEIDVPVVWAEIVASRAYQTTEICEDYAAPWGGLGVVQL